MQISQHEIICIIIHKRLYILVYNIINVSQPPVSYTIHQQNQTQSLSKLVTTDPQSLPQRLKKLYIYLHIITIYNSIL